MHPDFPLFELYVLGTVLLLLFVCYLSAFLIAHKQKQIRMVFSHNKKIMEVRLEAQEAAMNNLAKELHDHIKHKLQICRQQMDNIARRCTDDIQLDIIEVHQLLLEDIIKEVTDFSRALHFESNGERGIVARLENEVRQVNSCGVIRCGLHIQDALPELDMYSELNLIRIVQESIQNVLKHARAGNLDVHLSCKQDRLELGIRDDGIGIAEVPATAFGLPGIAARAQSMGGGMELRSAPQEGTLILVRIPLPIKIPVAKPPPLIRNDGF